MFECEKGSGVEFWFGAAKTQDEYLPAGPRIEIAHHAETGWHQKLILTNDLTFQTEYELQDGQLLFWSWLPDISDDVLASGGLGCGGGKVGPDLCDVTCTRGKELRIAITCGDGPKLDDNGFWKLVENVELRRWDIRGWQYCDSGTLTWYFDQSSLVPVAFARDFDTESCPGWTVRWIDHGYCWSVPELAP